MNKIIHVETLRYTAQRMPTERYLEEHPNVRAKDWKKRPMTLKEVDVLLSTILIIGIIGYPRIRLVITTISTNNKIKFLKRLLENQVAIPN